jgi:hypothetical protein
MKAKMFISCFLIFVGICCVYAWTSLTIENDPLVRMPGTQPNQGVNLEAPNRCLNCHAGYDQAVEPGFNWKGSMMAQAARDPIFWACFTVALQDSIWAIGTANAGDLCERCHFPEGWLGGRSDPPIGMKQAIQGPAVELFHKQRQPIHISRIDNWRVI